MELLKKKKKTIGLDPKIYEIVKNFCNKEGYVIQNFVEKILINYIDKLPK